ETGLISFRNSILCGHEKFEAILFNRGTTI
ncbi:hypothetical protein SNEBB_009418, partial [Seison nebaliae]